MTENELTERDHWENRWEKIRLPVRIEKGSRKAVTEELLRVIGQHFPREKGLGILEIGGAPGPWLAYFGEAFGYDLSALDYTRIGCQKTRENLALLGLSGTVYCCDLITDDLSGIPPFDIVYSLGFIEHFRNLDDVVGKHGRLLKKDGILMIGAPNFLGITRWVLQRTAPKTLSMHNLLAMDVANWQSFEDKYHLLPLFKGYLGGFDLTHCSRCEERTVVNRTIRFIFKLLRRLTNSLGILRRFNAKYWSPYVVGIYRKG